MLSVTRCLLASCLRAALASITCGCASADNDRVATAELEVDRGHSRMIRPGGGTLDGLCNQRHEPLAIEIGEHVTDDARAVRHRLAKAAVRGELEGPCLERECAVTEAERNENRGMQLPALGADDKRRQCRFALNLSSQG